MDIVTSCQSYGVNEVFVSSIIFNEQHNDKVRDINKLLRFKQRLFNFKLIDNDNIGSEHMWKDKIHLNFNGLGSNM